MLGCPCRRGTDACAGARGPVCPWGEFPCDCLCRPCCSQTSFLWTRDSRVLPSLSSPSRCFCLPGSRAPVRSRVAGPACLPPESSTSRWGRGGGGLGRRRPHALAGGDRPGPARVPDCPRTCLLRGVCLGSSRRVVHRQAPSHAGFRNSLWTLSWASPSPQRCPSVLALRDPGSSRSLSLQPRNVLEQAGTTAGLTPFVHMVSGHVYSVVRDLETTVVTVCLCFLPRVFRSLSREVLIASSWLEAR